MFKSKEKILIPQLIQENMCIDMHHHSTYSDGKASPEMIVNQAQKLGIGISITDHNKIEGCVKAYYMKKALVLPGIEVTSKNMKDILIYFYSIKDLQSYFNLIKKKVVKTKFMIWTKTAMEEIEIIEKAREFNGVCSLAHPYSYFYKKSAQYFLKKELLNKLDALEVLNGVHPQYRNFKAMKLAEKYNLGITAGSDGHGKNDLGKVFTASVADNINEFLDNVKKKKVSIHGRPISKMKFVFSRFILRKTGLP